MIEKKPPREDAVHDAIAKALDAATAATDAAHEAEAVLTARSEAAQSMARTARRSAWMAAFAGGSSVAVLVLGGLLGFRSSVDLHEAGEVQAAAAAGFVERLGEMNGALDRLDLAIAGLEAENSVLQSNIAAQVEQLEARLQESLTKPDASQATLALIEQIDKLRTDMVEAIAETQMSVAERLAALPAAVAPVPTAPPVPVPSVAPPKKSAVKPAARPAQAPKASNPFRYP